jgi:hypothetical protein
MAHVDLFPGINSSGLRIEVIVGLPPNSPTFSMGMIRRSRSNAA